MVLTAFRCIMVLCGLTATLFPAHAAPVTIAFTAVIGTSNDIDTQDIFHEGYDANLASQVIVGSVSIDPGSMTETCGLGGACYRGAEAGAVSVSFTLNGVTSTIVSAGPEAFFGQTSDGSVSIGDLTDGGSNYLAVGATSPDGMMEESIGVLFDIATVFSAYGGGDPTAAMSSLDSIGSGTGLVDGGITLLSPVEHLDATILTIDAVGVPEPPGSALLALALAGLGLARRKVRA